MRSVMTLVLILLAGCTSSARREADAEVRGYERGYRQAVKEQYWIIQQQQRQVSANPNEQP